MRDSSDLTRLYCDHLDRLQEQYEKVLADCGFDHLVLHSGTAKEQSRFDDQNWPLRPSPSFRHWLPLAEADCALLIEPGKKPILHRTVTSEFWEGVSPPESDHFWDSFELREFDDAARITAELPRSKLAFVGDPERAATWKIDEAAVNPTELLAGLDEIRALKSDYERHCIGEANRRATRGHQRLIDTFGEYRFSELDLHLLFLKTTEQDDLETPFKNIVAIGQHAAVKCYC